MKENVKMIIYNSEIYHYGIPRRSGRYKWGSGKDPYHHGADGGVRKSKKEKYASKAEAAAIRGNKRKYVKNFNKAVMAAEKENDSHKKALQNHGKTDPHSTGKEFDKVVNRYRKEINDYETSYVDKNLESSQAAVNKEGQNLIDKSPGLRKDFGSYKNIDDEEYFEFVASTEHGLNTDKYLSKIHDRDNAEYIADSKYFEGYNDILDKYTDRFREATLKDIGYKDTQRGMKLYKKYKIGVWGVY